MTRVQVGMRVQIMENPGEIHGYRTATPAVSRPHLGQVGTVTEFDGFSPRIELDNGAVLYGYECWWGVADNQAHASCQECGKPVDPDGNLLPFVHDTCALPGEDYEDPGY